MRQITQQEIDNAPDWADEYMFLNGMLFYSGDRQAWSPELKGNCAFSGTARSFPLPRRN